MYNSKKAYRLASKPFATGGQAEIFEAEHKATGKRYVFKRFKTANPVIRARARREIEMLQKMEHPNIMPLIGSDTEKKSWYTMPVAKCTLLGRGGTFDDDDILLIIIHLLNGLEYAHKFGWVHRDLTPYNILLLEETPPRWVIGDWGLVRRPQGQTSEVRTANGAGTPGFVAPELYEDAHGHATFKSDIYSLGRVVFWMVTGQQPQPNIPCRCEGRWDIFVQATTQADPDKRQQHYFVLRKLAEAIVHHITVPESALSQLSQVQAQAAHFNQRMQTEAELEFATLRANLTPEVGQEAADLAMDMVEQFRGLLSAQVGQTWMEFMQSYQDLQTRLGIDRLRNHPEVHQWTLRLSQREMDPQLYLAALKGALGPDVVTEEVESLSYRLYDLNQTLGADLQGPFNMQALLDLAEGLKAPTSALGGLLDTMLEDDEEDEDNGAS